MCVCVCVCVCVLPKQDSTWDLLGPEEQDPLGSVQAGVCVCVCVCLPHIPSHIPMPSCSECLVSVLASVHQTFWLQAPLPAAEPTLTCGVHLQKRIVPASPWSRTPSLHRIQPGGVSFAGSLEQRMKAEGEVRQENLPAFPVPDPGPLGEPVRLKQAIPSCGVSMVLPRGGGSYPAVTGDRSSLIS